MTTINKTGVFAKLTSSLQVNAPGMQSSSPLGVKRFLKMKLSQRE